MARDHNTPHLSYRLAAGDASRTSEYLECLWSWVCSRQLPYGHIPGGCDPTAGAGNLTVISAEVFVIDMTNNSTIMLRSKYMLLVRFIWFLFNRYNVRLKPADTRHTCRHSVHRRQQRRRYLRHSLPPRHRGRAHAVGCAEGSKHHARHEPVKTSVSQ